MIYVPLHLLTNVVHVARWTASTLGLCAVRVEIVGKKKVQPCVLHAQGDEHCLGSCDSKGDKLCEDNRCT